MQGLGVDLWGRDRWKRHCLGGERPRCATHAPHVPDWFSRDLGFGPAARGLPETGKRIGHCSEPSDHLPGSEYFRLLDAGMPGMRRLKVTALLVTPGEAAITVSDSRPNRAMTLATVLPDNSLGFPIPPAFCALPANQPRTGGPHVRRKWRIAAMGASGQGG